MAIATDNSQYAELSATTLNKGSGKNRFKLDWKGFLSTTDESLLCITSVFNQYSILALHNCLVGSLLFPEAPQDWDLVHGLYHVIYSTSHL